MMGATPDPGATVLVSESAKYFNKNSGAYFNRLEVVPESQAQGVGGPVNAVEGSVDAGTVVDAGHQTPAGELGKGKGKLDRKSVV